MVNGEMICAVAETVEKCGKQTIQRERRKRSLSLEGAARKENVQEVRENKPDRKHDEYCLCMDKDKFSAFQAMVINCAAEAERNLRE